MMKNLKNINIVSALFVLICLVGISNTAIAQKKEKTRARVYYEKLANNNGQILVLLTQGSGSNITGVPNVDIQITSIATEEEKDLATIQTNADGEAILQIENGYPFELNEKGYAVLNAKFAGNDSLRAADKDIEFLNLDLNMTFEVVDSVNVIKVLAQQDSLGVKIPIEEIEVQIGVKRLHSILFLETIETDEDGVAEYEFPNDIPGDGSGNITVVAKVVEDDDFGTVTTSTEINWGTIVDYSEQGHVRALFGDEAPLWMIIGVFAVLIAVWYHFVWAVIKVWQIKKLGKEA